MKNKKRRMEFVSFYDYTGIQAHLEKMAAKGWLLEKMTAFGWVYRRIEPKKMHFAVTFYPPASEYDPEPSEKQRTYWEFCEYDGWHLAAAGAQMQIFYNEEENPAPIETDAGLQVKMIHKAVKKNFLLSQFVLLLLGIMQAAMHFTDLVKRPMWFLADNSALFSILVWLMVIILCIAEIGGYYVWHHKAKKAAEEDGSFLPTHGSQKLQKVVVTGMLFTFVLWILSFREILQISVIIMSFVYMGIVLGAVFGIKNFLKRKKVSTEVNRAATIAVSVLMAVIATAGMGWFVIHGVDYGWFERKPVSTYEYDGLTMNVYHDELPLRIEDMRQTEYKGYSYEKQEQNSIFLSQTKAWQKPKLGDSSEPNLMYTVTRVKFPGLYDICLENILKEEGVTSDNADYRIKEMDKSLWNAEKVYQFCSGGIGIHYYFVCYSDRIVEIGFGWEPAAEEIGIAADILAKVK